MGAESGYEIPRLWQNGHTEHDTPRTNRMVARPVWRRHMQRVVQNVNPMPPPTDEERYDAIRVLEDLGNEMVPGLWLEAHRIVDESSP